MIWGVGALVWVRLRGWNQDSLEIGDMARRNSRSEVGQIWQNKLREKSSGSGFLMKMGYWQDYTRHLVGVRGCIHREGR